MPLTWVLGLPFHARMNSIREGHGDGSRARNPFAVMARLAPRAGSNVVMREGFRYALACNKKRGSLGLLALSIHMSKRLAKSKIQPGSGGAALFHCAPQPNCAVKGTPTKAMPSAFSWPLLVPSAPAVLQRPLPGC